MIKNRLNIGVGHVKKALAGMVLFVLFTQCVFFGKKTLWIPPPDGFRTTITTKIQYQNQYSVYDLFQFYHNNKTYDYPGTSMSWTPIGEKYLFKYDTLHPEGNYDYKCLERWHPVFLPGEVTNYTVGTLLGIHKSWDSFDYIYTIQGNTYARAQCLALNDRVRNHPQLVKGARFLVEYLVADPQRAIIYIDKPKTYIDTKGDSMLVPDIHVLRPTWYSTPVVLPDSEMTKHQAGW